MLKIVLMLVFALMFYTGCAKKVVKEEMPSEIENITSTPSGETTTAASVTTPEKSTTEQATTQTLNQETNVSSKIAVPTKTETMEVPLATDKPTPSDIQTALKNAGLYDGKVDGNLGPKTKKAIEKFQTQNNLKADGKVGTKTWNKLKTYLHTSASQVTR